MLDEFYRVAFRKKIYRTLDELQADVDAWVEDYNHRRPHSGRYCYGKTPMQTFLEAKPLAWDKQLDRARAEGQDATGGVLSAPPHAHGEVTDRLLSQGAQRSAERPLEEGRVPLTQQAVAYPVAPAVSTPQRGVVGQSVLLDTARP
jgi:hypothetical protein